MPVIRITWASRSPPLQNSEDQPVHTWQREQTQKRSRRGHPRSSRPQNLIRHHATQCNSKEHTDRFPGGAGRVGEGHIVACNPDDGERRPFPGREGRMLDCRRLPTSCRLRPFPGREGRMLRDLRLCGLWERRRITPAGWPGRDGNSRVFPLQRPLPTGQGGSYVGSAGV